MPRSSPGRQAEYRISKTHISENSAGAREHRALRARLWVVGSHEGVLGRAEKVTRL